MKKGFLALLVFFAMLAGQMYSLPEAGAVPHVDSHDIESTIQYASHILHLQESALFYGTAQEYQNSAVGKRFLGGEGNA